MLRVHDFGFLGMDTEKCRVETIRVFQNAPGCHVMTALPQCVGIQP